ncbi:MAG: hypothetical protein WC554_16335, partial [Clostridia bacterium]
MKKYIIRPLQHILDLSNPTINSSYLGAGWPTRNVQLDQNRVKRRWGYTLFRTLDTGASILGAYAFKYGSSEASLVLTDTDLIKIQTGTSETFSYLTDTYATGTITSVTDATPSVVTGSGTDFTTCAAGDKFILNDDHSASIEPDAQWATIAVVTDATHMTLTGKYGGTKDPAVSGEAYKIRRVFSAPPTGERIQTACVDEKFCFTHRNINVQQYTGTGYTSDLNSVSATNAKFCISYANRLWLADMVVTATRMPWRVMWSKEGDPTDWTDTTAGAADFISTEDRIQGMGVVGSELYIYKDNGYHIGQRTGEATAPVIFPTEKRGIGVKAPYSIVNFMGTNAFLGRDDFYAINGGEAESIGERIRYKFFDMVADAELVNVW